MINIDPVVAIGIIIALILFAVLIGLAVNATLMADRNVRLAPRPPGEK
jgi:hypothetical protein